MCPYSQSFLYAVCDIATVVPSPYYVKICSRRKLRVIIDTRAFFVYL